MDAVSVHGKLVYVMLIVHSLGYEGMDTLIANSPQLLTFFTNAHVDGLTPDTEADLKRKYSFRRLFICGSFEVDRFGFPDIITDATSSLFP